METELSKILEIVGGQTALAKKLQVSNNAVSKWVAQGYVPPGRVLSVYELVEGTKSVDLRKLLKEASAGQNNTP